MQCHFKCVSLTWEIASEAGLSCDHPLSTCLTEYSNSASWLLAQCCQATAKESNFNVQLLIYHPLIITQNEL